MRLLVATIGGLLSLSLVTGPVAAAPAAPMVRDISLLPLHQVQSDAGPRIGGGGTGGRHGRGGGGGGGGGGHHGGGGHRGGGYHGGGGGDGWEGAAAGAAIGLFLGAVMSAEAQRQQAVQYCMRRYRSYDPYSMTFVGRDGRRYRCP